MLERHPSLVMLHAHDEAKKLAERIDPRLAAQRFSTAYGHRQFSYPMLALQAKKKLGPCRHALSQMVVAGTMVVQPPVQVRITSSEDPDQQLVGEGAGSRF